MTIVAMVVVGLSAYVVLWLATIGMFLYAKLSGRRMIFSDWSWPQFLVTTGFGLGITYIYLLLSAGF